MYVIYKHYKYDKYDGTYSNIRKSVLYGFQIFSFSITGMKMFKIWNYIGDKLNSKWRIPFTAFFLRHAPINDGKYRTRDCSFSGRRSVFCPLPQKPFSAVSGNWSTFPNLWIIVRNRRNLAKMTKMHYFCTRRYTVTTVYSLALALLFENSFDARIEDKSLLHTLVEMNRTDSWRQQNVKV